MSAATAVPGALDVQPIMDEWDMLIIRACKANLNDTQWKGRVVCILARRSLLQREFIHDKYVAEYLMHLVDQYRLTTLSQFTDMLLRHYDMSQMFRNTAGPENTNQAVIRAARSCITCAPATKFPGMRWPTKFKRL